MNHAADSIADGMNVDTHDNIQNREKYGRWTNEEVMINTLYGTYTRTIIFWEESRYRQMSQAIKLHLIMQGHWVVLSLRAGWHVGQGHLCLLELFGLVPFFVVSFCRQRSTVARGNRSPTRTPTTRDPSDAVTFFQHVVFEYSLFTAQNVSKVKTSSTFVFLTWSMNTELSVLSVR